MPMLVECHLSMKRADLLHCISKPYMKKTQTILIIDDEKDLCELIRLILKDQDYKVVCAFSLKEGNRKWENLKPAVVLLDQNLPDGSGLGLVEHNPSLLSIGKVIMITADTRPD